MTPPSENFGSTAQVMLEVLDKAAVELSKVVTECLEMVAISGLSLQKSLMFALRYASENYQGYADGKFDDLDRKKQDILEQLQKFEESQIEAVESTAKIVREAIMGHAESIIAQISQQLDENAPKIATAQKDPNVLLRNCYEMAKPAIEKTFNGGKQKLEQIFNSCHSQLEAKTQGSSEKLSQQAEEWNRSMSARMEETLGRFEQHVDEILSKLQSLIVENMGLIETNTDQHLQQAGEMLQKSLGAIDKSVEGWRSGLSMSHEDLGKDLNEKQERDQAQTVEMLGQNLDEMNLYLTHLSSDHAEKAFETHRSYVAALDKIENACVQRLEHLHEYFSSLLAGYSEQSSIGAASETPSTEGHRGRLEASLTMHSGQVIDAASSLVAQLDADLSRNSEFLNEKIETIKNESINHFKEQVKDVETEAEHATKEFRRSLSKLEGSVKEIDDAGQSAAVTVTAYLGTVLSLEE